MVRAVPHWKGERKCGGELGEGSWGLKHHGVSVKYDWNVCVFRFPTYFECYWLTSAPQVRLLQASLRGDDVVSSLWNSDVDLVKLVPIVVSMPQHSLLAQVGLCTATS